MDKLTKIQTTLQYKGFKALVRYQADDKNKVYITWKNPNGCELADWDNSNIYLMELYYRVRAYVEGIGKKLWSY